MSAMLAILGVLRVLATRLNIFPSSHGLIGSMLSIIADTTVVVNTTGEGRGCSGLHRLEQASIGT